VSLVSFSAACRGAANVSLRAVPCGEVSTCPNDPPATQADTDACDAEIAGACSRQYAAYHDCYGDMRVCAFNGTTDVTATQQACIVEALAVEACGDGGTQD
jgi:hypothetical protein